MSEQCIRIREIKNACAASRRLSSDGLRVLASAFSAQPEKPQAVAATIEVAPHDEEIRLNLNAAWTICLARSAALGLPEPQPGERAGQPVRDRHGRVEAGLSHEEANVTAPSEQDDVGAQRDDGQKGERDQPHTA